MIAENAIQEGILTFLASTRVRWESREGYENRRTNEWPIVRRGDAMAEHYRGQWVIWQGGNPIGLGATNSQAWQSTD
jgi:hypothetical protein